MSLFINCLQRSLLWHRVFICFFIIICRYVVISINIIKYQLCVVEYCTFLSLWRSVFSSGCMSVCRFLFVFVCLLKFVCRTHHCLKIEMTTLITVYCLPQTIAQMPVKSKSTLSSSLSPSTMLSSSSIYSFTCSNSTALTLSISHALSFFVLKCLV